MKNYSTTRYAYTPKRNVVWREICRWLNRRWISPFSRILELGSGYGDFIGGIVGKDKLAIEKDDGFAPFYEKLQGVTVRWADAVAAFSQLPSSSRDVIFASNFFEHFSLEQVQLLLKEVIRVLAPRGKLIVLQPNFKFCSAHYFDDWTHRTPFSHISFSDLLETSGFCIDHCYPRFLPFSFKTRLPVFGWLVRCYLASPYKPRAAQFLMVATKSASSMENQP